MAQTAVEPQYEKLTPFVSVRGAEWYASVFQERGTVK